MYTKSLNEYIKKNNSWWLCPSNGQKVYAIANRIFRLNNASSTSPSFYFGYPLSPYSLPKKLALVMHGSQACPSVQEELCMLTYPGLYASLAPPHGGGYNKLYFDSHVEWRHLKSF